MKDNEINASVEQQANEEASATASDVTLGTLLKAAREKMGLSIADTAVKLHLRPSIVQNLEADDFSNIASSTYVRGYVKNYARMLGIDNAQIEACLARQVPTVTPPAMQSFSRKTTHQARDTRLKWLSFVIVAVLLGSFVAWWVQRTNMVSHVDVSKPTAEEVAAANQTLPGDVLLTETDASERLTDIAVNGAMATDGPVQDTDPSTIAATAENGAEGAMDIPGSPMDAENLDSADAVQAPGPNGVQVPAQTAEQVATQMANQAVVSLPTGTTEANQTNTAQNTATETAAIAGQSTINIQLSGDCWINILDANSKAIVDGVRGAGANIQVSGVPPFKVILGAPTAVTSFSVDGQAISLAEYPKGRVARLTIPKA
ncbi:DUF4115 domain-containing protein [Shewanella sp. A25]|nr:DUF4115 domain-containing protein [Shewanella shenzhenensis]